MRGILTSHSLCLCLFTASRCRSTTCQSLPASQTLLMQPMHYKSGTFGTRSQTVLAMWHDGRAELREQFRTESGSWQTVRHVFCWGSSCGQAPETVQRQQEKQPEALGMHACPVTLSKL